MRWILLRRTPALRGTAATSMYLANGELVGFTYNDHVLHEGEDPALDLHVSAWPCRMGRLRCRFSMRAKYSGSYGAYWLTARRLRRDTAVMTLTAPMKRGWVGNRRIAFIGDTRCR